MAQYISKDALVTEIERLIRKYSLCPTHTDYEKGLKEGRLIGYKDVLFKVNTSEMKEVDLDKEIKEQVAKYYSDCEQKLKEVDDNDNDFSFMTLDKFAKYFFELGLKAQKKE